MFTFRNGNIGLFQVLFNITFLAAFFLLCITSGRVSFFLDCNTASISPPLYPRQGIEQRYMDLESGSEDGRKRAIDFGLGRGYSGSQVVFSPNMIVLPSNHPTNPPSNHITTQLTNNTIIHPSNHWAIKSTTIKSSKYTSIHLSNY